MLIAFSYLKTVNRSLINIQCPISFKVPTCIPFTALLIILPFYNRLLRCSLTPINSVGLNRIQYSRKTGEVQCILEERCLDQHSECCYRDTVLRWGCTLSFTFLQTFISCGLPISSYHHSFFSLLFSFPYSFSLHFSRSLSVLKFSHVLFLCILHLFFFSASIFNVSLVKLKNNNRY